MDLEEDGPPDLVDISELNKPAPSPITTQMQNLGLSKVPITIVTGRNLSMTLVLPFVVSHSANECIRVPGSRENYVSQLYSQRTAWKEDCSHIERLVYTMSCPILSPQC